MTLQEIIDNEKKYSYEDGLEQGLEQGMEQGLKQGLENSIRMLKKLNVSEMDAYGSLMEQFSLTDEEVAEYMKRFW